MKKVSIKDIAELSGVSVATVSRVINDNGRFSEKTREKVLAVIEETGYQMNFSAKSLRMKKTFSIGILVPDISNYFFSAVVQQIEAILFEKGYSTIICNTARSEVKEQAYLKMLESKLVDGLIVISGAQEFEYPYADKGIPFICIDRQPKEKAETIFISSNHYQGAFEATEALLQAKVKQPLIIMYGRQSSSAQERLKGFKDALKKNNVTYEEARMRLVLDTKKSNYRQKMAAFFASPSGKDVDGVFAINDNIAIELLNYLTEIGKKIPNEVKVIGFDDTPFNNYSSPKLSSVKQNIPKIAQAAVDHLLARLNDPYLPTGKSEIIPVQLILRESV